MRGRIIISLSSNNLITGGGPQYSTLIIFLSAFLILLLTPFPPICAAARRNIQLEAPVVEHGMHDGTPIQLTAPTVGPTAIPLQNDNTTSPGVWRTSTTSSGLTHIFLEFFIHFLLNKNLFIKTQHCPVMSGLEFAHSIRTIIPQ